ncbi:MAG: 50S ribosomal protein L25 [Verrucomicrobia bacterium]|nr:50S ribosomal protein L25 [Verrucomicrobiota bacterium]
MKQISIQASKRENIGGSWAKRQRTDGLVPAVLYGENGVRHIQLNNRAFKTSWRSIGGRAALLELHIDGEAETTFAIIQDVQRDTRTDAFLHVDFKEIVRGKDMEADIPVVAKGTSNGVKNQGGVLEIATHTLSVRCRPRNLPEAIEIDVSALNVGESLHLRDITAPEGVTFLDDADLVVVACVGSSSGASEAAAETAEATA